MKRYLPLLACALPALAWAHAEAPAEMPWGQMLMGLFGGLAIFLYGMEMMTAALKSVAGDRLQEVLARLTRNRWLGVATGAGVTAVIQSSSATTVLVVGFVASHFMTLTQSLSVIMGAHVGTTITGQIVAFKVTQYALAMIASGFAMHFLGKGERVQESGRALMGLGLVFFGMGVMGDAMEPLRQFPPFLEMMRATANPLLGIAVAAAFTALVQSSSATTAIVIVMASQGLITLEAGIALAMGANIGTCVTALLAAIGKRQEAKRVAVANLLLVTLGVLLWVWFIEPFAEFVTWLSPQVPGLIGSERLAAEAPRQIANANTLFNVANMLIFIGFVEHFARLVRWLVPERPTVQPGPKPRYLDELLLSSPTLALDAVRRELPRVARRAQEMLDAALPATLSGSRQAVRDVVHLDDDIDVLYGHIIRFLGEINKQSLSEPQNQEVIRLMEAANALEALGDVVEVNLMNIARQRIERNVRVSPQTRQVITRVHGEVARLLALACQSVLEDDRDKAQAVVDGRNELNRMIDEAFSHQAQRLVADESGRVAAYSLEKDMLVQLRWVYHFARQIAKTELTTSQQPLLAEEAVSSA